MQAGKGTFVLSQAGVQAAITVNITQDARVIITPTFTLNTGGAKYTVTAPAGVVQDVGGNGSPILSGTTYEFTVADSAPSITVFNPAQGATIPLLSASIVLQFSEVMQHPNPSLNPSPNLNPDWRPSSLAVGLLALFASQQLSNYRPVPTVVAKA